MRTLMSHERSELTYPIEQLTLMQLGSSGEESSGMQVRVGCTLCWNSIKDIENPQRIHRKMPFGGLFYFLI